MPHVDPTHQFIHLDPSGSFGTGGGTELTMLEVGKTYKVLRANSGNFREDVRILFGGMSEGSIMTIKVKTVSGRDAEYDVMVNGQLITTSMSSFSDLDQLEETEEVVVKKDPSLLKRVIMSDEMREEIMASLAQIENSDKLYKDWGFEDVLEKGRAISMLFYGVPGTGKTMTGEAIAKYTGRELRIIQSGEVQSSQPGQTERNIKSFFETADTNSEVLLFDECDSLIYDRSEVGMILGAEINSLLSALEQYSGVVIFTTNRLGKMDPAFERRVSAKIEFPFPDKKTRTKIWKGMIPKKAPIAKDVDLEKLAEAEIAGGNVKNVVISAARLAIYRKQKEITVDCFADALKKEMASISRMRAERKKDHNPYRASLSSGGGMDKVMAGG